MFIFKKVVRQQELKGIKIEKVCFNITASGVTTSSTTKNLKTFNEEFPEYLIET